MPNAVIYDRLPNFLKVLDQLNHGIPGKFPKINSAEYYKQDILHVWIDSTQFIFKVNADGNIGKWFVRRGADQTTSSTIILLHILYITTTFPKRKFDLFGIPFKFNQIDIVIEYYMKLGSKRIREILPLMGLLPKTINSYLRSGDIKEYRKRRKSFYRKRVNDVNDMIMINRIFTNKIPGWLKFNFEYIVKDKIKLKLIVDTANKNNITTAKLKDMIPLNNLDELNRIINIINEKRLLDEAIDVYEIISKKFGKISKTSISGIEDTEVMRTINFRSDHNDKWIFNERYDKNLIVDACREVFLQLFSKFRGNPNIPILMANIPVRFDVEEFVKTYGMNLSSLDVLQLLKLFKCNELTASSIIDKYKKCLRGAESNPINLM